MYEELENWWLRQGGALNRLQNVRIAFRLIENRDGVPGCCPDEFSEAVVHAGQEDWDNLPPTPHERSVAVRQPPDWGAEELCVKQSCVHF